MSAGTVAISNLISYLHLDTRTGTVIKYRYPGTGTVPEYRQCYSAVALAARPLALPQETLESALRVAARPTGTCLATGGGRGRQ